MNGSDSSTGRRPPIRLPQGARQHATAGPYSPVLEVDASRLVVLSGQVAIDLDGNLVGSTMEEQARATLQNCAMQLATAGCTFANVFKVNVYVADLGDWARFNAVYVEVMREPLPVRTAIQAVLLPGFLLEVEMWAVKAKE